MTKRGIPTSHSPLTSALRRLRGGAPLFVSLVVAAGAAYGCSAGAGAGADEDTSASAAALSTLRPKAPRPAEPTRPTRVANHAAQAALGKALFFDTNLSQPAGTSCASCHAADAGFSDPDSAANLAFGTAPGAVVGRFGNRKVPTIAYAALMPEGPPHFDDAVSAYVGGMFFDGRAPDLAAQAATPLQNPDEMNNVRHGLGDPDAVVREATASGAMRDLFAKAYGRHVLDEPADELFADVVAALVAYESTKELSPFTSKYDAYVAGKADLSESETNGLRLVTGTTTGRPGGPPSAKNAQCVLCHGIPSDHATGPDLWTNTCFANLGVPRNERNPYYRMTDERTDPLGFNAAGAAYVDLGLGGYLYPRQGLPPGNTGAGSDGRGDYLAINGTFKAPTLRDVGKRPDPTFVKAYMHNGVFKSLEQVVHFYNTRNLTTVPGEVIDFSKDDPYAGLKGTPLWDRPEFPSPDTLQNVTGATAADMGQIGNLGLTTSEEADIVAFLRSLSDGYLPYGDPQP